MATQESLQQTVEINGKRHYCIDNHKLPSVTTIIGEFEDKSFLDKWYKRIGYEEAKRISKFSANRGSVMHQMIEYYLENFKTLTKKERLKSAQSKIIEFSKREGYSKEELQTGRDLFYNFYHQGFFDKIKRVISIEETLWSLAFGGYAGRVDAIYEDVDGNLLILDFKTSKKQKKDDWIDGYKMQICAYYIAYWERTGKKPNGGEIWIACESGEAQLFKVSGKDINKFSKIFLERVKKFHKLYD